MAAYDIRPRPDDACDTCGGPRLAHPVKLRGGFTCQSCRDRPDGQPWRWDEVGGVTKRRPAEPRAQTRPQDPAE